MPLTQSEYCRHAGLTRARVSQLVKAGMPLDSAEAADRFRSQSGRRPGKPPQPALAVPVTPLERPPEAAGGVDRGKMAEDGPEGAYERQKAIERAAYDLAQKALKAGTDDAGRLIQIHTQAAKNLGEARKQVISLRELEKSLVSGVWVRKVMSDHDGAVVTLVRAMPKQLAGRICPHDPEFAESELDRWAQEVFLKTLNETDPWKTTL